VGEDYLDSDEAQEALAAAEALTFLLGKPARQNAYTESVEKWAARIKLLPPAELIAKAQAAVTRILGNDSELRELWDEAESGDAWRAEIASLQQRLG
jgi:hypothetical protein